MVNRIAHGRRELADVLRLLARVAVLYGVTAALPGAMCSVLQAQVVAAQQRPGPANHAGDEDWLDQHEGLVAAAKRNPDTELLLIGDSITDNYHVAKKPDQNFRPTWDEFYAPRKALNLGVSGDTTDDVIWRMDHGEVDGLHPKVAIILIGTNDTARYKKTAEQAKVGIDALIGDLEEHFPTTKLLLLGVLPSDRSESKSKEDARVNRSLALTYVQNPRVTYLDISSIFYRGGVLNTDLFYDPRTPEHLKALHPDTRGQRMMAEAIEPTLAKLMGDEPRVALSSMTDINTALIPVPQLEQDSYDWYARHQSELELGKTMRPDIVMVGDSITHFWGGQPTFNKENGAAAWSSLFKGMTVMNLGFGWDRTQNVLWRLRQVEFDNLNPKWVVVNIGTNNLTGSKNARANTPDEVVESVGAICAEIHERSPESRIVVMGIFPRDERSDSALRNRIRQTNQILSQRFSKDATVTYLDIGSKFLAPDGTLPKALMPDGTHPSEAGYRIWAEALIQAGVQR